MENPVDVHNRNSNEIRLPEDESILKNSFSQGEEIAKTIPLFAENFEVSKKNRGNTIDCGKKMDKFNKKNRDTGQI